MLQFQFQFEMLFKLTKESSLCPLQKLRYVAQKEKCYHFSDIDVSGHSVQRSFKKENLEKDY